MIHIKEIDGKQLEDIRKSEIFSMDSFSYTELFKTDDRKLTKLYKYGKADDCHMIHEDIKTLFAVSELSEMFGAEYVLPQNILRVGALIVGYEMPLIDGMRLSDAMRNCDSKTAIRWFTRISESILFLNSLDEPLAFGDLHEDNILIDKNGKMHYCDIDGFRILRGRGKYGRYISMMPYLCSELPEKYMAEEESGAYLTDKNSDIACLVVMIMNYIMSGSDCFAGIPVDIAREYVYFIEQKGMPDEIIEMVRMLYRREDNFISLEALQKMPVDLSPFSFGTFKAVTSKFKSDEEAVSFIEKGFMKCAVSPQETCFQTNTKGLFKIPMIER